MNDDTGAPDVLTLTMNPALDVFTTTASVVPAHKLRCTPPRFHPGGGGINVARVLHRFGTRCEALFPTGGPAGEQLCGLLAAEGVPTRCIPVQDRTRESFSVGDEASGQEYRFVLPGPTLAEAEWQACLQALASPGSAPRWLVASGSLPPGVPDDFYARVARLARAQGSHFALDASGAALAAGLREGVHVVKPSLRELRELTGQALQDPAQWTAAAQRLVHEGRARFVALSLGEQGALLVHAQGAHRAPAVPVAVRGTIGAGDSFLAGLVRALNEGQPPAQALREAMATAAASLLHGATTLCRPEDMAALRERVQVEAAYPGA